MGPQGLPPRILEASRCGGFLLFSPDERGSIGFTHRPHQGFGRLGVSVTVGGYAFEPHPQVEVAVPALFP